MIEGSLCAEITRRDFTMLTTEHTIVFQEKSTGTGDRMMDHADL